MSEVSHALSGVRGFGRMFLAAALISVNWCLFIWSVQAGHVVEASLGYFIFPLVTGLLGMLFFAERPDRNGGGLSAGADGGCGSDLGSGGCALYRAGAGNHIWHLHRTEKIHQCGAGVSVTAEVGVLVPIALVWLWGVHNQGWTGITGRNLGIFGNGLNESLLLVLSGPMTAGPLILFSYASKRLRMATVGLMQYVNPTLQFLVAVLIFAEPFTRWHGIAFPLIWTALLVYTLSSLRHERAVRRSRPAQWYRAPR